VSPRHRITAVGVVVPAHNEQERIGACLRSVRAAMSRLPDGIATAVTVVLDRCSDATPELVEALVQDWPEAAAARIAALGGKRAGDAAGPEPVHIVAGSGVGAVRDLGVRLTLHRLRPQPLDATWLLHTDADTTVPPDWAVAHLRHAATGASGVAGLAELSEASHLSAVARRRYRTLVRDGLDGGQHGHVHGANLGVRADAYVAVGGFPSDGTGEDHGLWHRLDDAGYELARPTAVRVHTSARLRGGATGGLADLLRSLQIGAPRNAPAFVLEAAKRWSRAASGVLRKHMIELRTVCIVRRA
jgi:glycosyltransferase involved in cell wall biosynthesis